MIEELRRPGSILKELDRLHELIVENRRLVEENPAEFALELNLMSLENREKALLEELGESNRRLNIDTFDLDIDGEYVEFHRISSDVLGKMLIGLQGVVYSMAHSVSGDSSAMRGPIPQPIIFGSRIDVVAACAGSFKIILSSNQPALGESLAKTALRRFNALLDCTDNEGLIKQEIGDLGTRTIKRYKDFLDTIYKTNSKIKLYDAIIPEGFETKVITPDLAKRIWDIIDREEAIPDKEESYRGIIKGLSLIKYKFQFIIQESGEIISGDFDPKLSETVKNNFDKSIIGQFRISTKRNEITEELYKNYTLLGFIK